MGPGLATPLLDGEKHLKCDLQLLIIQHIGSPQDSISWLGGHRWCLIQYSYSSLHIIIGQYRLPRRSEESDVENSKYKEDSSEEVMEATTSMVCFMLLLLLLLLLSLL